ncbi:hypothetical protein, variant [Salpingoeca rosetta]|nr:hypothetical protein, variant [Salpingoeca rosetta]EGD77529.1 hypothetical protein, variant [Salpingoeca rosetta]|eukprot:XP_004990417.1 hypothetical protein, variant [Salpingoeca rosetta]
MTTALSNSAAQGVIPSIFDDTNTLADVVTFGDDECNLLSSWLDAPFTFGSSDQSLASPGAPTSATTTTQAPSTSVGATPATTAAGLAMNGVGNAGKEHQGPTSSSSISSIDQDVVLPSPTQDNSSIFQSLRSLAPDVQETVFGDTFGGASANALAHTAQQPLLQFAPQGIPQLPVTQQAPLITTTAASAATKNPSTAKTRARTNSSTKQGRSPTSPNAKGKLDPTEKRERNKAAAERYRAKKRKENEEMRHLVRILKEQVTMLEQRVNQLEMEKAAIIAQVQFSGLPGAADIVAQHVDMSRAGTSTSASHTTPSKRARKAKAKRTAATSAASTATQPSVMPQQPRQLPGAPTASQLSASAAFMPQHMLMHMGVPVPTAPLDTSAGGGQEPATKRARSQQPTQQTSSTTATSTTTANLNATQQQQAAGTIMALAQRLQQLRNMPGTSAASTATSTAAALAAQQALMASPQFAGTNMLAYAQPQPQQQQAQAFLHPQQQQQAQQQVQPGRSKKAAQGK